MLLWLNLFFLMAVALIPFTTSVMSDHQTALPTMMYAAVLMAVALLLAAIWGYACRRPELISTDVTPVMRRQGVIDPLFVAAVFALSIGVAYVAGLGGRPVDVAAGGCRRTGRRRLSRV